jgi:hypothetical protein
MSWHMSEMRSSPTYQAILAEGRAEGIAQGVALGFSQGRVVEARALLLRLGWAKFGRGPTKKQQAGLDDIADLVRLESLAERLLQTNAWGALLAGR